MPTKRTYRRYRRRTRRYPARRRTTYRRRAFVRSRFTELKHASTQITNTQATTSKFTLVNNFSLGTDQNSRIGRRIVNKSVSIRGYATNGGDSVHCRVMLVYDRRPNGAFPAITDLLQYETTVAQRNRVYMNRFVVLRDLRFILSAEGQDGDSRNVSIYRRMNLPTYFSSSGNGIADIQSGSLFVLTMVSNINVVAFIFDVVTYAQDS